MRKIAGQALGCVVLAAIFLGTIPPGYAALFGSAYQSGTISAGSYAIASQAMRVLVGPGRLLLAATPYHEALSSTDGAFWRDLAALVVANCLGWLALLLALEVGLGRLRSIKTDH